MKQTMKQPPQCMSFTLMFPRLGKAFNYCKMIGSHARWWNDLVLSGDFILFHHVENNASGVSPWWNYFLLSPHRFMQKVQFCWHSALINVHDIMVKPSLRLALVPVGNPNRDLRSLVIYLGFNFLLPSAQPFELTVSCFIFGHYKTTLPLVPKLLSRLENRS